ncbi:hypothetical protein HPB48_006862 [Haemaphysalis longicornis]|uniref:Uncharacterized protein n=1 Tax=Haemaphysalis longicornis TaxID=44386 RepID=A0A9J6FHC8_HAELO|nr:hypothetical protein HPB48_006862 [Haemaphysalis longicornis]
MSATEPSDTSESREEELPGNGVMQPPFVPPASRPLRTTNQLLPLLNVVVKSMWKHRLARQFRRPVDAVKLNIPDYHKVIPPSYGSARHPQTSRKLLLFVSSRVHRGFQYHVQRLLHVQQPGIFRRKFSQAYVARCGSWRSAIQQGLCLIDTESCKITTERSTRTSYGEMMIAPLTLRFQIKFRMTSQSKFSTTHSNRMSKEQLNFSLRNLALIKK